MRLVRMALLLAALALLTATLRGASNCNMVCEDLCAQENDGLSSACLCDFGDGPPECGCICSSYPGSHVCGEFPGCEMVWD